MKKKIWLSKTFWMGMVTMILPAFSTQASTLIAEHTPTFGLLWGALAIVLRLVTKEKVALLD